MTVTLAMLEEARDLAIQLKDIKEREMILRIKISKALNKDQTPGTANYDQDGMRVKLKVANNTSIDQEELISLMVRGLLTEDERTLIRTKYDLKLGDYKKADFDTSILEEAIIVKPAAPTLTITLGD